LPGDGARADLLRREASEADKLLTSKSKSRRVLLDNVVGVMIHAGRVRDTPLEPSGDALPAAH